MADAQFTVQDPLLHDEPVGQWLARVMQKEQNRVQLAQLEDGLVRFLNDTSALYLRVPPGTALRRRICIEVGTRFRLDHRLEPCPGTTADQLVLVKTPRSAIPRVLLSSVPPTQLLRVTTTANQTPAAQPDTPKPATFLRRPHSSSGIPGRRQAPASGSASANQATALKRISVEEYELARARIFKGGDSDGNTAGKTLTTNATEVDSDVIPSVVDRSDLERGVPVLGASSTDNMENSKPITARRRGNRSSTGYDRSLGVPSIQPQLNQEGGHGKNRSRGSQQTSGVEERSREYGNGYRSQNGVLSNGQSSFAPKIIDRRSGNTNGGGVGGNLSNGNSGGGGDARNSMNRSQQANQNANSDRDDPDFDRRYDKWALRREPSAQALPLQPQLGMPVFSQFVFPFASHSTAVPMHGPGMSLPGMGVPDASVPRPSQHNPATGISNSANQFSTGLLHSHRTAGVGGMPSMFSHRHVTPLSAPPGYFPSTGNDASRAAQADVVPMASGSGYGLDSPADFPPLSRVRTAEQRP